MSSKLCPHTFTAGPDARAWAAAGAPLVKLVDGFGAAQELLSLNPNLIIVGGVSEGPDVMEEARRGSPPEAAAKAWVNQQQDTYRAHPLIKIWEGPSAPDFGPADDPASVLALEWFGAFEAERLRLLADLGLRGVAGNFPTGAPRPLMWPAFLPALEAIEQHRGCLGLREYASPWLWWGAGRYSARNCEWDENFAGEGDSGAHTLRYRKVYRDFLIPNGFGRTPLVISECGLGMGGETCPGQPRGPWRDLLEFWRAHDGARDPIDYWRGPERDPERYYAEQLLWYDRELQKDDFVIGAAVFTLGAPPGPWQAFDIGGTRVAAHLVEHLRAMRTPEAVPVEAVAPRVTEPAASPAGARPRAAPVAQVETTRVPPAAGRRRSIPGANRLINASFESGLAYFADDTRELAVPMGWRLSYHDETTPLEEGQTAPFGRPLTALINSHAVPGPARKRVFAGGVYCWKIAGGGAPVWVRLVQPGVGVKAGQAHRFTVNLLPDMIVRAHPQMMYASDPLAGEVRLSAVCEGQVFDTGWKNGRDAPFGRYTLLSLDFLAPADRVEVRVEVRSRWALPETAWYVDELSLIAL
jgi:hypothetical protein